MEHVRMGGWEDVMMGGWDDVFAHNVAGHVVYTFRIIRAPLSEWLWAGLYLYANERYRDSDTSGPNMLRPPMRVYSCACIDLLGHSFLLEPMVSVGRWQLLSTTGKPASSGMTNGRARGGSKSKNGRMRIGRMKTTGLCFLFNFGLTFAICDCFGFCFGSGRWV
jgi:hypothetical protein